MSELQNNNLPEDRDEPWLLWAPPALWISPPSDGEEVKLSPELQTQ
jgi:hypothetical protein